MSTEKPNFQTADGELVRKQDLEYVGRKLKNGWVQTKDKDELVIIHFAERSPRSSIETMDIDKKAVRKALRNKGQFKEPEDIRVDVRHQNLKVYEKEIEFHQTPDITIRTLFVGVADSNHVYYLGFLGIHKKDSMHDLCAASFNKEGQIIDLSTYSWQKWGKGAISSRAIQHEFSLLRGSLNPFAARSLSSTVEKLQNLNLK